MKEIDLRAKEIGSYDFTETNPDRTAPPVIIRLKDLTFPSGSAKIDIRTAYIGENRKLCNAVFKFTPNGARSLENFLKNAKKNEGLTKTFADNLYCSEIRTSDKLPYSSPLAMDMLRRYGKNSIKNEQDVCDDSVLYLTKAMVIHFLSGLLWMDSHILVTKITRDGSSFEYAFYFTTPEITPLEIGIKAFPGDNGGFLETSAHQSQHAAKYLF